MSYAFMKWSLLFDSISEALSGKMAALEGFSKPVIAVKAFLTEQYG